MRDVYTYKFTIFFIIIILIFCGCNLEKAKISKKQILNIALPSDFNSNYDPLLNPVISFNPFYNSIYSSLFKFDKNLNPRPDLISKYIEKEMSVTFFLKNNAKFSNGKQITSEDVIWSIERTLKKVPSTFRDSIKGGMAFIKGETKHCSGIKSLTEKKFKIIFNKKNLGYKSHLASVLFSILPKNYKNNKKIFSGPYLVTKEKRESEELVLVNVKKNPYYCGENLNIDNISFMFCATDKYFEETIRKETIDIFLSFAPEIPQFRKTNYIFFKTPMAGKFFIMLNPTKQPFSDKSLRKYFKSIIQTKNFRKLKGLELVSPVKNILPHSLLGSSIFRPIHREKPTQVNKPEKMINIKTVLTTYGIRKQLFGFLEKNLKKDNLNLIITWNDYNSWFKQFSSCDFDLSAFYYLVNIPESESFYKEIFLPKGELNPCSIKKNRAINLLQELTKNINSSKRLKILWKLEKLIRDEAYLIPVVNPLITVGYKDFIKNVEVNSMFEVIYGKIQFEERN